MLDDFHCDQGKVIVYKEVYLSETKKLCMLIVHGNSIKYV